MARGRVAPTSFTAGRRVNLAGTVYAVGATIPNAVVARLRHASALLTRRIIIPNAVHYPNKYANNATLLKKPRDYTLNWRERRNLGA